MCSAAYEIGSAADLVFISSEMTMVGSIGAIAQHTDVSRQNEQLGIKKTEIFAGRYKNATSPNAPLSEDGITVYQDMVDHGYTAFVNDVARNRGVSVNTVIRDMADAKVFHGSQAIEAGLVDGVSTLSEIINRMSSGVLDIQTKKNQLPTRRSLVSAETEANLITKEQLKADNSALFEEIYEEGKAAGLAAAEETMHADLEGARKIGATAELERIKAVRAHTLAGHEALIEAMMFDGTTTGPQAAEKVLTAEKALQAKAKDDFIDDGINAKVLASPHAGNGAPDFDALVGQYQAQNNCSRGKAISAVTKANPAAHQAYLDKVNKRS
jgi:hypothetical protein